MFWVFGGSRQFPGAPSSLRSFAGPEDVLDESCGSDVGDELVPVFDDNPATTRGTTCSVFARSVNPKVPRELCVQHGPRTTQGCERLNTWVVCNTLTKKINSVFQSNQKQDKRISKHKDLSALGRRQLPPQGCTAIHRVGILTVFSGEDTVQLTALLPAQERLLAGVAQQFRLNPRQAIRETAKLRFHAVVGDATGSVSDCEVGTREPAQEDAVVMATEGAEDWAESEKKKLV